MGSIKVRIFKLIHINNKRKRVHLKLIATCIRCCVPLKNRSVRSSFLNISKHCSELFALVDKTAVDV